MLNIFKKKKVRGFEFISNEQLEKDLGVTRELFTFDKLPMRGTKHSSGYDFFSPITFTLAPNDSIKLPTGIKSYMRKDEELLFFPRSGLGFKYFVRLANTIGKVDCDYYNNESNEGHIWVKIRNEGTEELHINVNDAICQASFYKYLIVDGDSYNKGDTRKGGFGSTSSK